MLAPRSQTESLSRLAQAQALCFEYGMSAVVSKPRQFEAVAGQATYGMSNLREKTTGLPFVVFISQRDDARHAARVKWSTGPRVIASEMGSYAINPFGHKRGPKLGDREEKLLATWVALNASVLQQYWDGEIAFTEDAIERLRKT